MKHSLSVLEKSIIRELSGDLPVTSQPFVPIARKLGVSQRQLLQIIKKLKDEGFIRRFGATARHRNVGFPANAMVVWRVPGEKLEEVGRTMSSYKKVTHCYHRCPQGEWKYNLYTMIHGSDEEKCRKIAEKISRATAMNDYQLLFSRKEFKKTTMRYFNE